MGQVWLLSAERDLAPEWTEVGCERLSWRNNANALFLSRKARVACPSCWTADIVNTAAKPSHWICLMPKRTAQEVLSWSVAVPEAEGCWGMRPGATSRGNMEMGVKTKRIVTFFVPGVPKFGTTLSLAWCRAARRRNCAARPNPAEACVRPYARTSADKEKQRHSCDNALAH